MKTTSIFYITNSTDKMHIFFQRKRENNRSIDPKTKIFGFRNPGKRIRLFLFENKQLTRTRKKKKFVIEETISFKISQKVIFFHIY